MKLDIKRLLELRGDELVRELYRIHKATREFGFLKANSRDLIRMKNKNIAERNERKELKLLEQGRSSEFEPVPPIEEVFVHDFERIKDTRYTRFKENVFIFPYFDDRENKNFYKKTVGSKDKNRIIPGGFRVLNPNKIEYLLGVCEIHFEQYKVKMNQNDERHSKNDDFKRNQFLVYIFDYEEGYWKEVKDLDKRSEDPMEPTLADVYFERKAALEMLNELILLQMDSYYKIFDEVIEKIHGRNTVTTEKTDVLKFLDAVQLFLNKKLMLGLIAQRIVGAIESDEIDELLNFAKTLVPKIVNVSEKIRNFVPQEVSGLGITGNPEEKSAILEYGKLREELIHAFRKAREKTTDMAEIIFGGYLKSSFKKGRLYPNLNEFEARNYLKTNAVKTNERMRYYENMANHIKEMIGENKLKNEDKDEDKKAEKGKIKENKKD